MLGDGVPAAVPVRPDDVVARSLAFWFATTGIGLVAMGLLASCLDPGLAAAGLADLGPARHRRLGAVMLPSSPFWVFPLLAVVAGVVADGRGTRWAAQRRADRGAGLSRVQG